MPERFLAEFEMYVMLAVARLGDDAYGGAIREEIETRVGRPVSIGALYATLNRLGSKGLVRFEEEATSGRSGRPRKYVHLTDDGQEALDHSTAMLQRMMDGVAVAGGGR
jgi:DNA-binding PadR family transcriptional regulator